MVMIMFMKFSLANYALVWLSKQMLWDYIWWVCNLVTTTKWLETIYLKIYILLKQTLPNITLHWQILHDLIINQQTIKGLPTIKITWPNNLKNVLHDIFRSCKWQVLGLENV